MDNDPAHIPEHSVMDVLNRALNHAGEADRVLVVLLQPHPRGGDKIWQFSNARSSAELTGMYVIGQGIGSMDDD